MADDVDIQAGDVVDIVNGKVTKSYSTNITYKYIDSEDNADYTYAIKISNNRIVAMFSDYNSANNNHLCLIDYETLNIIHSVEFSNSSEIADLKILYIASDKIVIVYRRDSAHYAKLVTINNDTFSFTSSEIQLASSSYYLDVILYDPKTLVVFTSDGSTSVNGRLHASTKLINDQFTNINSAYSSEIGSATSIQYMSSCVIESATDKKIFAIYNASNTHYMYYVIIRCEENGQITTLKTETRFLTSIDKIQCIKYKNSEIAITYRTGYAPSVEYILAIISLTESNNIQTERSCVYTSDDINRPDGLIEIDGGVLVFSPGATKTMFFIKDTGAEVYTADTVSLEPYAPETDVICASFDVIGPNKLFITIGQYRSASRTTSNTYITTLQIFNDSICTDVRWSSKDAIALTSGTENVDIGFAGIIEADWISQGDKIISPGVCGVGVLNNVLQVIQPSPQSCQIAYGSYDGTGQYGESNPNILTFDFVPKLVIVSNSYGIRLEPYQSQSLWYYSFIWIQGVTTANVHDHSNAVTTLIFNQIGNTLRWYTTTNPGATGQMNVNGTRYYYIALG